MASLLFDGRVRKLLLATLTLVSRACDMRAIVHGVGSRSELDQALADLPASSTAGSTSCDHVLVLDGSAFVAHDWLFPRCAVVLHHGGAGTTATALRHARPQVLVPFLFDQPYFAEKIAFLQLGAAVDSRELLQTGAADELDAAAAEDAERKAKVARTATHDAASVSDADAGNPSSNDDDSRMSSSFAEATQRAVALLQAAVIKARSPAVAKAVANYAGEVNAELRNSVANGVAVIAGAFCVSAARSASRLNSRSDQQAANSC